MPDAEEEERVKKTLMEMKEKLEAHRKNTQPRKTGFEQESKAHISTWRKTLEQQKVRSKRHTVTGGFSRSKSKGKGKKGARATCARVHSYYPWHQRPKLVRKIKLLGKAKTKIRGQAAFRVHIPLVLKVLTHPYFIFPVEITLCIFIYSYYYMTSYQAFFDFSNGFIQSGILHVLDYIFICNLLLRLVIECWRAGEAVDYIVLFTPCTPRYWLISLVALAPTDYVAGLFLKDSLAALQIVDWLKINRWILPYIVHRFFTYLDEGHYVGSVTAFFLKYFALFLALIHFVACLFFYVGGGRALDLELNLLKDNSDNRTWIMDAYRIKFGIIERAFSSYLLSYHLSAATTLTTGFGDVAPNTEMEMILSIFVMLVGAICLSGYFNSRLTGYLLVVDGARNELFRRLDLIVRHLKFLNAPAVFVFKTQEYYHSLWNFRKGVYRVDSIRKLPGAMYEDILYDICSEMFNKALLFRELEEPFLRQVAKTVEILIYNPDMMVCRQGQPASAMYFIIQGEIAVKHPVTARVTTAILRPGCIFGETRLFFSMNNPANIETRTCCQLLVIRKDRLLNIGLKNLTSLNVMRARMSHRMAQLHEEYEQKGEVPVVWIRRRRKKRGKRIFYPEVDDFKISLRWASWFDRAVNNLEADQSIALGASDPIIVDMPSAHPDYSSEKFVTYAECVIPMTLLHPSRLVQLWHILIAILSIPHFLAVSYGYGFGAAAGGEEFFEPSLTAWEYLMSAIYLIDLILEIFTAAPVTGIYYKLWDGLRVCQTHPGSFIVNFLSIIPIPLAPVVAFHNPVVIAVLTLLIMIFGRYLKMHKVVRYIHFLYESFPAAVPYLRLWNVTFWLAIHSVVTAASFFWVAYPFTESPRFPTFKFSWLASYYMRNALSDDKLKAEYEPNYLLNKGPFTLSVYYGVTTFTSTGLGDFSPQSLDDIIATVTWEIFAFFLLGILAAQLTSGLASASLPRIRFEGKLNAFRKFFELHGLTMCLRDRIDEHYRLQYQLNEGIILPRTFNHIMYDAPPYLSDDALFAELSVHLEGIPVFTNSDPKTLISMAKNMKLFLLPPNITFIRRGEVRRQMYVVSKGSLAVMREDTSEVKAILMETGHLGLRDLLYGEPWLNNVKTLSYCMIYSIDLANFNEIMAEDEDLLDLIDCERKHLKVRIRQLNRIFLQNQSGSSGKEQKERKPSEIPSWIQFPTQPATSNEWCTYDEYEDEFDCAMGRIGRFVLMRRAVHPAGTFALIWCLLTALAGVVAFLALILELFAQYITPYFSYFEIFLQVLFSVDIYVRLHWGYYTKTNLLISHPMETAKHYLCEGPFLGSYFFEIIPYGDILWVLGATDFSLHGDGLRWAILIHLHRVFHIIRAPIFVQFGRHVSFLRTAILCFVYILLTLAISSFFASIAIYFACPWDATPYAPSIIKKLPACFVDTWVHMKNYLRERMSFGPPRWLLAIYYVCQLIFGVGYGDQVTLQQNEVVLACVLMIFGYVATRCIISDMTATAVSSDEIRTEYLEKLKRIVTVMKKQEVDGRQIERVQAHLQYVWLQSHGLEPQDLFRDLHPALLGDFYREYIGDTVASVPLLAGQSDNILRFLCTHLKQLYFVRGDVIARRNCLELEMYIIVEGKVWITGQNLELECELGPGETFGETQMLHGVVRKYSAIAASNVEVFALSALNFGNILEHYPSLKDDMNDRMMHRKADMYERKIYYINHNSGDGSADDAERTRERVSDEIRRILSYDRSDGIFDDDAAAEEHQWVRIKRFSARWICSWGSDDANLPFFYLAARDIDTCPNPLLHPRCGFQRHFSTLILFVSWLSPAVGIYLIFFGTSTKEGNEAKVTALVTNVLEYFYITHMIVQFFTPFVTVEGKYCKQHGEIIFRNLFNFSYFWLDLISCFPIEYAVEQKVITKEASRYFHIVRLCRLVHYFRKLHEGLENVTLTTFRYNLVLSVTSFGLVIHVLACVFYFVSECLPDANGVNVCPEGTWTRQFLSSYLQDRIVENDLQRWKWYVRSLFWVVATMSTTGYGELIPVSLPEVGTSIICIFCGAFVLAIVLSLFTQGLTSLNSHESDYLYQLKVDSRYLRSLGLSTHRQASFEEWYLTRWRFSRGVSFTEAVEILPLSIRNHVNLALYHETLSQVPLFEGLEQRFFLTLASLVEHTVYLEGQTVAFEGDRGQKLFIVSSGRVSGYRINQYNQPKLIRWYTEGCIFGRLAVFFYDETYTKTYRAEILTEILVLRKQSIFYLARFFPAFALRLQLYIEATYDKKLGGYTVFDNPPEEEEEETDPVKLMFRNNAAQISPEDIFAMKLKMYGEKVKKVYEEVKEDESIDDEEEPQEELDYEDVLFAEAVEEQQIEKLQVKKKMKNKPAMKPAQNKLKKRLLRPFPSRTTTGGRNWLRSLPRPPTPPVPAQEETLNWKKIRAGVAETLYISRKKADVADIATMGTKYVRHGRKRRNRFKIA